LENTSDKQGNMLDNLEQLYESGSSYKEAYLQWGEDDCNRKGDIRAKDADSIEGLVLEQLKKQDYNDEQWKLIHYLIHCLDERGFLCTAPEEVIKLTGITREQLTECLQVLKNLEPVGIFSENLEECLKKQLEVEGIEDEKLFDVIDLYLPDILKGHISKVSRALDIPTVQVKEYIHLISKLNPRPIMNMEGEEAVYIIPDILIHREDNSWNVELNDRWMGDYRYNDYYIHMMQNAQDEELKKYFREKYERARFVVDCIEQRRNTIIKIVKAVLELQEDYFLRELPIKAMSMEQIAEKTGIHVSTVSRAIKGKYIQYKKVELLRELFSKGTALQEENSVDEIKRKIAELIENEDKSKPLSDSKISNLLKREGIQVSRRAVTNYRAQLGIRDSRQREYL